jgi:Uma2 family endonuclease
MPPTTRESVPEPYYTANMVRALPEDGNRYELVYGELLVSPAPRLRHQLVVGRLYRLLCEYLDRHNAGLALMSPADISWGRDDVLVQPDVFVVPLDEARTMDWFQLRTLLLVAEVLSPSTAEHDRFLKRRRYQEAGAPLYWIVDADEQCVEVWTPADAFPRIERARLTWQPADHDEMFELSVSELLAPVGS